MFKNAADYASQMLDLYGDADPALTALFDGPKQYPQVPNRFWRDVSNEIIKQAVARDYPADRAAWK